MRRLTFIIPVICVLAGFACFWLQKDEDLALAGLATPAEPEVLTEPVAPAQASSLDVRVADEIDVFQRAFWRRPGAGDKILHAERHETRDAQGITEWQWFIAVKASPELLKYLRDDNAFGLVPAESAQTPDVKPEWFNFNSAEVSILKSPRGNMRLYFNEAANTLYATDGGKGFSRGAPDPSIDTDPVL